MSGQAVNKPTVLPLYLEVKPEVREKCLEQSLIAQKNCADDDVMDVYKGQSGS